MRWPHQISFVEALREPKKNPARPDRDLGAIPLSWRRVAITLFLVAAVVLPFITEKIYQDLIRSHGEEQPESVHLCDMPLAVEARRDKRLESQMALTTRAVVLGRALDRKSTRLNSSHW